jgi:hypothetical protein
LETNNEEVVIEDPKAVLSALERAKSDAKKFREEKENLESILSNKEQVINNYSSILLKEKIAKKISEEGIKDPERVLKFVNMSNLSLDDNFDLIGFEDQIEQLKSDLPEIFDAKLRVGGQADTAVQATVSTKYSATQLQAARILGRL